MQINKNAYVPLFLKMRYARIFLNLLLTNKNYVIYFDNQTILNENKTTKKTVHRMDIVKTIQHTRRDYGWKNSWNWFLQAGSDMGQ